MSFFSNGFKSNTNRNIGSSISIGICLPANCKIHHLEAIVNDVIDINVSVKIPEDLCQLEESVTNWKRIDFVTL